jgi:AAA15 family ATPase/GTPase
MFIQFNFGNFRSFKNPQVFSMEAAKLRPNDNGLDESHVIGVDGLRLLKTKAIFGSNSSGKSNLARAISAFVHVVTRSVAEENVPLRIWDDRFQLGSDNWDEEPLFFQYVFLLEHQVYRYGFQILKNEISSEWLFQESSETTMIFLRSEDAPIKISPAFLSSTDPFIRQAINGNSEVYRPDALFLTAGAISGNHFLTLIRNVIRLIITADGAYDNTAHDFALRKMEKGQENKKAQLLAFLEAADTGIEGLEIVDPTETVNSSNTDHPKEERRAKKGSLYSVHSRYDENGSAIGSLRVPFLVWESQGTSKLFSLGSLILDSLTSGNPIVIDEFDSRLHPNLTLKLIELFQKKETNPLNAQLIFVTHDSGILKRADLRRDQVCLVDRNRFGVSSISTLIEYKGVRKDASHEKEYLNGSYAGVPYLDRMDAVVRTKTLIDGSE